MRTIIIIIFVTMLSMTIKAQFILASNPDVLNSASSIENTGNAVEEFYYQPMSTFNGDMRLSVCDGSKPSFVWSSTNPAQYTDGILGLPSGIEDPDVAIGEKGQFAMVVYVQNGNIVLEQYRFDMQYQGFYLQSGPLTIGKGENPNLDIYSYDGTLVSTAIVWQDGVAIKSCIAGGFLGTVTPVVQVNLITSNYDYLNPDVSIRGSGTGTGGQANPMLISYTYIEHSITDGDYLIVQQEWLNNVANNTLTNNVNGLGLNRTQPGEQYGHPRIATPWQLIASTFPGFNDFSVVVDRTDGNEYWIESVTSSGGMLSSSGGEAVPINFWNNVCPVLSFPNLVETQLNTNKKPAIDYIADNIVIAWTYFDGTGNTPGIWTYEVLQRKLYITGSPAASFYSVVNFNNQNDQIAVSVASRYSTQAKVLYSFSTYDTDLAYKYSHINNSSLRIAHESVIGVYPNPFSDALHIEIENENSRIEIIDMQGRIIYDNFSSHTSIDLETGFLSSGLYLLRIRNVDGVQTKLIEKY